MKKALKFGMVFFFGGAIGATCMYFFLQSQPQFILSSGLSSIDDKITKDPDPQVFAAPNLLGEEGFPDDAVFKEFEKMREKMREQFKNHDFGEAFEHDDLAAIFGALKKNGAGAGGRADSVRTHEDESFVYYDISVHGAQENKIETKVERGQVIVSGEVKKDLDSASGGKGSYTSSFQRVFPVPEGVDAGQVEMITQPGKILLKFPKKKSR